MAKEVRCVLFTSEEVRRAVAAFLRRQMPQLQPYAIEKVEMTNAGDLVSAKVAFHSGLELEPSALEGREMLAAVLLHCRGANIPLSRRSTKKLEVAKEKLVLITSMNLEPSPPVVEGGAVVHTGGADKEFVSSSRDHAAPTPQP